MTTYNYAEMNASVPQIPLQLINPNVGSSNKVGVQVNNYLVSDQAEIADPFVLSGNPSLRPENNAEKLFKITLDFSDSRKRSYELTTKTSLPVISRNSNINLNNFLPLEFKITLKLSFITTSVSPVSKLSNTTEPGLNVYIL